MLHSRRIPGRGCCSRGLTLAFVAYPGRDCCSRGQTTTLHRALGALLWAVCALCARRGPERPVAGRTETYKNASSALRSRCRMAPTTRGDYQNVRNNFILGGDQDNEKTTMKVFGIWFLFSFAIVVRSPFWQHNYSCHFWLCPGGARRFTTFCYQFISFHCQ